MRTIIVAISCLLFVSAAAAQRAAVITPVASELSTLIAGELETKLADPLKVLDSSMAMTAFSASAKSDPLNMTTAETRTAGSAVGADFLILITAKSLRRTSSSNPEYYEAYAAIFVVSTRSGKLVKWFLRSFTGDDTSKAERALSLSVPEIANEITKSIRAATEDEPQKPSVTKVGELPLEASPEAKGFRSPVPYRRIKPEYTSTAYLYDVAATVEVELTLAADGKILSSEVTRWAGFGLDESVLAAVRAMSWRPAERDGKSLPIRVLLRYNFKKIEK